VHFDPGDEKLHLQWLRSLHGHQKCSAKPKGTGSKIEGQSLKQVFHLVGDFEVLHFKWLMSAVSSKM
jgi:hypothetical protein